MQRFALVLGLLLLPMFGYAAKEEKKDSFRFGPTVIYGEDDRLDLYQVTSSMHLDLAESTVALVRGTDVRDLGTGVSELSGRTFGEAMRLCQSEPFFQQKTAAFCSGFLVGEDTLVTAGHCVESLAECKSTKFVFGFAMKNPGAVATEVMSENVYGCENLVHTEQANGGADFAVIKLDRRVMNKRPLEIRREGVPEVGQEIVVIGHPSGLPTKVAAGAKVRSILPSYFVANLDTYGGNSGSAVFNNNSGTVEGILVRGERDFIQQNGCTISYRCPEAGCRGEDVTRISTVLPYLN